VGDADRDAAVADREVWDAGWQNRLLVSKWEMPTGMPQLPISKCGMPGGKIVCWLAKRALPTGMPQLLTGKCGIPVSKTVCCLACVRR
jgi:hypothetical protein